MIQMTGLLWFDNTDRTIKEKIVGAAAYYRQKYGVVPDRCYVNAGQLGKVLKLGRLLAIPAGNVLNDHFWVGVDGQIEPPSKNGKWSCPECGAEPVNLTDPECWQCGYKGD